MPLRRRAEKPAVRRGMKYAERLRMLAHLLSRGSACCNKRRREIAEALGWCAHRNHAASAIYSRNNEKVVRPWLHMLGEALRPCQHLMQQKAKIIDVCRSGLVAYRPA